MYTHVYVKERQCYEGNIKTISTQHDGITRQNFRVQIVLLGAARAPLLLPVAQNHRHNCQAMLK